MGVFFTTYCANAPTNQDNTKDVEDNDVGGDAAAPLILKRRWSPRSTSTPSPTHPGRPMRRCSVSFIETEEVEVIYLCHGDSMGEPRAQLQDAGQLEQEYWKDYEDRLRTAKMACQRGLCPTRCSNEN